MSHFLKDARSVVNKLKEWIQGHHVTPNITRFKKDDETYTETDEEKLEILSTHFEKVFNSDVNIDWSILSEINQKPVFKIIDITLQFNKFTFLINKLTLHRAAVKNCISPNAIKALDKENKTFLFEICSDFFENKKDIEEWQIGVLKILPKKGDLSNPNNWRGINLLDVVSKVISIVITNRLQIVLKKSEHPCSLV